MILSGFIALPIAGYRIAVVANCHLTLVVILASLALIRF